MGDGKIINSEFLNGLSVLEAKEKVINAIEKGKFGTKETLFRLRIGEYLDKDIGDVNSMIYLDDGKVVP